MITPDIKQAIQILDRIGYRSHGGCVWKVDGVQVSLFHSGLFQIYGNSYEFLNGFEIFEELARRFPAIAAKLAEPV